MFSNLAAVAVRIRVLSGRILLRLGFGEDGFLLLLAILIGMVTAAAAVGFHELIVVIRDHLYAGLGPRIDLYRAGLAVLILLPALGGLAVALLSRYLFRSREGHGVVDVVESVVRSSGLVRPLVALEKIITSGITIGTGGSAGAEGPIVQIGAAIASGVGQLFRMARQHLPVLIGCGSAAGISAIFNSPIGGVFFTLEVILLDFSLRTFTPVVLASVIANVATKAIFGLIHPGGEYEAIFALPVNEILQQTELHWAHLANYVLLGLLCGVVGVSLTRLMHRSEAWFASLKLPRVLRPALGGAMMGLLGVLYVIVFGWWLLGKDKPVEFSLYPLPAFFSDGYGVIRQLVGSSQFYSTYPPAYLLALLAFLCLAKILATCATLASGGSGGIIAPSLFLGAAAGGLLGMLLRLAGLNVQPNLYALVGMGAVLAAVVHAPLASILILLELTHDYKLILPAMLASVVATGVARMIFRDSIYTLGLRARGIRVGTVADLSLLRRISVEQTQLEPASVSYEDQPLQKVLELADQTGAVNFVVVDENNQYVGMLVAADISKALLQREAVPLLLAADLMRTDIPMLCVRDDLATALDQFARHDVDHLPVCVEPASGRVAGILTRVALMRRYQRALAESA